MTIDCVIKFDHNPHGVYYAGQVLTGQVEITLDKPKKVKGISLRLSGFSESKWSEYVPTHGPHHHHHNHHNRHHNTHNHHHNQKHVTFSGREDYLSTTTYLTGSSTGYEVNLPAGKTIYTFSFSLPATIPTSFEGKHGHVRYTTRVTLERPWKFDQTYKVAFTVVNPFDLNHNSFALRIPCQMEVVDSFCCGPCKSGPFYMVVTVPQTGYVPGQEIKARVQITNRSSSKTFNLSLSLRKTINYYATSPYPSTKTEFIVIQEKETLAIMKADYEEFNISLLVPAVPPTNVMLGKIVHITYEIKVQAHCASMKPKIKIPITIGTVPLYPATNSGVAAINPPISMIPPIAAGPPIGFRQIDATAPAQMLFAPALIPTAPAITPEHLPGTSNTGSAPEYQDIPPPSYEESVFGNRQIDDDDQHAIAHQLYTPKYPVYRFNS